MADVFRIVLGCLLGQSDLDLISPSDKETLYSVFLYILNTWAVVLARGIFILEMT